MIETTSRPAVRTHELGRGGEDGAVAARPQVPTPTYLTSGPQADLDQAMAALSDAVERSLQEDLASGMTPTVEHLAVDVVRESDAVGGAYVAVALALITYRKAR